MSVDLGQVTLSAPFSGVTDANGQLSLQVIPSQVLYGLLALTAQAQGNPSWTVSASGQVVGTGSGPTIQLPPLLTYPGQPIVIKVTGALANTNVAGVMSGVGSSDYGTMAAQYNPSGQTINVQTSSQVVVLGTIKLPATGQMIAIPPNIRSFLLWVSSAVSSGSTLTVTGTQSGYVYLTGTLTRGQPVGPIQRQTFFQGVDSSLTITGAGSGAFVLLGYMDSLSVSDSTQATLVDTGGGSWGAVKFQAFPLPVGVGAAQLIVSAQSGINFHVAALLLSMTAATGYSALCTSQTAGSEIYIIPNTTTILQMAGLGIQGGVGQPLYLYSSVANSITGTLSVNGLSY